MNKTTADMAQMVAQVPALLEALTGKKFAELSDHVRRLGPVGLWTYRSAAVRRPSVPRATCAT